MAFKLADIKTESIIRAPRMLILGVEGIGKTSFACGTRFEDGISAEVGINKPVLIPCKGEEGADSIGVPMFPTCNSPSDLMDALESLYGDHDFQTVVLDSASALGPLVCDSVCESFGVDNVRKVPGFRTGEAAILNIWREILDALDGLRNQKNMASMIIGHVKIKKHKNPEGDDYDKYDMDLEHQDVVELLKRWADVILFANTKVVVKKEGEDTKFSTAKKRGIDTTGGKRFVYTQQRPSHPGKGRGVFGKLPYELPLDWAEFEKAVAEATEK
jgi:hypothetical protein